MADSAEEPAVRSPENAHVSRPRSAWRSFLFAVKAIEIRLRFVAVLIAVGLTIGYWDTIRNWWDKWTRPSSGDVAAVAAGEEFYCPMHPSVVRDQPDPGGATPKCPICGMPLSLRKKGEAAPLPEGVVSRVQLSPYRVELAGIRTVAATREPLVRRVQTVGYVTVDESRRYRIVVRIGGYLEELYVDESFVEVAENQPLASIYSPELYAAANDLIVAAKQRSATTSRLLDATKEKLRLLGVADAEIDEILKSGEAKSRIVLRSPHAGRMLQKNAIEGDRVEAGQMLFEVADLSVVWIESEVFEKDAALIQVGDEVEATIDAYPGEIFRGRVALIHPQVQSATRTLRVRFEVPNPEGKLLPGMFAEASLTTPIAELAPFKDRKRFELPPLAADASEAGTPASEEEMRFVSLQGVCPVTGAKLGSMGTPVKATVEDRMLFLCCAGCEDELAERPDFYLDRLQTVADDGVLAVPESAVIDTGAKQIVYVEREPGTFEGVEVTLGPLADGKYAVIDGILPGDRVAAAGAFLVDAETRLNPSAAAAYFGAGGTSSSSAGTATSNMAVASVDGDKAEELQAALAKLTPADRMAAERQKICPITGLSLGAMGTPVKVDAGGKTIFLCCEGCRERVLKDPAAAIEKIRTAGGEVAE